MSSIVSRTDAIQISNNLGNTYTSQIYTIDSHIHQIAENESFNYKICASDTLNNSGCSSTYTDIIEFPLFPPNAVTIYNPRNDSRYNNTIVINHTNSFSATGQIISNYSYYYKLYNSTDEWEFIYLNNYPTTTYNWDIENILNGQYILNVIVTDSENLQTITTSEIFNITNPLALDVQLLTDILAELQSTKQETTNIKEGINMLWFLILLIVGVVLPFATEKMFKGNKENMQSYGILISIILFVILFYLNTQDYFNLDTTIKTFFNIIFLLFIVLYGLWLGEK